MENPDPVDDEVIADSEGEMGLDSEKEDPGMRGIMSTNSKNTTSQVSAFTLMGQPHDKTTSSISAFTAGPSAVWRQNSIDDNTDSPFIDIASIADRAKTRQRNRNPNSSLQSSSTKLSNDGRLEKQRSDVNISSDIIELTSDENDDELSLRPLKPKPKPKARPKPKFNTKDEPKDRSNDKTLDVSGTTEMTADKSVDPIPRPRPRPRPLIKRSKTAHESAVPPPPLSLDIPILPPSSASVSHGPELPIATSPARSHLDTSCLPPSDPPLPTLTTIHDEVDLPRIETLPNLDFDGPLSSPSSLFSDFGDTTKKRKRAVLDRDIDELASDSDLGFGKGGVGAGRYDYNDDVAAQVPPHMLPPPPTFFASSSSSNGGGRIPPPEPTREVVDLTMLPPTIEPTSALAKTKKTAQAKKSRQKKGDAVIADEDKCDDNFDPTEYTKQGKAKPKPKPKTKKSAEMKAKGGEGQRQVEVLIVSKPRTQRTKGKGKEKATAGNKDTFKSREFIDDSGDEEDLIQLIPSTKDPATSNTSPSTPTNGKGTHISADTSAIAPIGTTSTPLSKTPPEANTVISPGNNANPGKSTSSSSNNRMNKKRKSIIESDPEDEEGGKDHSAVIRTSAKKHKGNNGSTVVEEAQSTIYSNPPAVAKKGKKGKNVVRSDEDESDDGLSNGRKPASRKENEETTTKKERAKEKRSKTKSKKTVANTNKDGNEAYMEDHEDTQDQQLAPEAKENVVPPLKPTAKTSTQDDRPKVENPALFPSLHSRYEIAPRRSSLPMSELIRRANSVPGSPFATPHPRTSSSSATRPIKSGTTYSPYLKSSRSFLSRIAPLHPNRRTPPPPPPPPPPKKKTKKELEMEEKWEEELIDSLGGISEWTCLADDEKKALRRAKWAKEMGDWDD